MRALAAGAFVNLAPPAQAQVQGNLPRELPANRSVHALSGDVKVNGRPATTDTVIQATDTVTTGAGSHVIFAVGRDAFHLRAEASVEFNGKGLAVSTLRLIKGGLLSVFGKSDHRIVTATSVIGIRGTGVYAVADEEKTYICTCYGLTDLATVDGQHRESVDSKYHDAPRYIYKDGYRPIQRARVIGHTDEELMLIENLVGRTTPFASYGGNYGGTKR